MMQAAIILICIFVGAGAYYISGKNDTATEQLAESILEKETGVKLDFSPDDPVPPAKKPALEE